ncbi:unnamed protein product, partial [Heterosigma akashiwo]
HDIPVLETSEIASSVPLQICLSFNVLLSLVFFSFELLIVINKLYHYEFRSPLHELLVIPIFLILLGSDTSRLYFAYQGNLRERIPSLIAFLMITVFPEVPVLVYLALVQELIFPFDQIMALIIIIICCMEFILGYRCVRSLIQHQTARFFRLCQEEEIRNL